MTFLFLIVFFYLRFSLAIISKQLVLSCPAISKVIKSMSLSVKNLIAGLVPTFPLCRHTSVRFRYYSEKIAKGPLVTRFGYKDNLFKRGHLPRVPDADILPKPEYIPHNSWTPARAYFGQNDYIDILGGGKIHPSRVLYHVPRWLRGINGKEFQLILKKREALKDTDYPYTYPTQWNNLNKRINYLYKYLNSKSEVFFKRND